MSKQISKKPTVEQLHQSVAILIMKLVLLIFLLDSAFLLLLLGFSSLANYPGLHHHYFVFLSAAQVIKYFILTAIALQLVSSWASRSIYINDHHLIVTTGVLNKKQKVYELQQLRAVEVRQSWLGQRLKYGTVLLSFATSDYKARVELLELAHPEVCANFIEKHLGQDEG